MPPEIRATRPPGGTLRTRFGLARRPAAEWATLALRILAVALLVGELYVTAVVQRPDLLHPTSLRNDPSTYVAAGERLNAGHLLYGPLQPGDRPVNGYPARYPAPTLSPPLVAVIWRPLALLGDPALVAWWLGSLGIMVLLVIGIALRGDRRSLLTLLAVQLLGIPISLEAGVAYRFGLNDPITTAGLSGNLNSYLVGLFVLTWWAASRRRVGLAGLAAGCAAMLKLSPVVLLWWFVTRRSWSSTRTFLLTSLGLGIVGLVFAGLAANLAFVGLAFEGSVRPTGLSAAALIVSLGNLVHEAHLARLAAAHATLLATSLGLVLVVLLRRHPRAAFAAAILTVIYSSPVVNQGNFALLLALAAPWAITEARPEMGPVHLGRSSVKARHYTLNPSRRTSFQAGLGQESPQCRSPSGGRPPLSE